MSMTLADFLGLADPAQEKSAAASLEHAPELASRALPGPLRKKAIDAVIWTAKALLRDPLSGVLGEGWAKLGDLQKFDEAPPDEVNTFTLQDHEIGLSRKPTVEIEVNGAPTGLVLAFELKVALTIVSADLLVKNKRLIGAQFGAVRGGGTFSLGRATIAKRETAPVELPARFEFTPGMKIR